MRWLRKYLPFTIGTFQSDFLQYRLHMLLWAISDYVTLGAKVFLWIAIFNNSPNEIINGFSLQLIIVYILAAKIVSEINFVQPQWIISDDIKKGTIAIRLIKPTSYRLQILFSNLGNTIGSLIFFAIPASIILSIYMHLNNMVLPIENIALFLISVIVSYIINFLVAFMFANLIFYTTNAFGVMQFKDVIYLLLSGSLIPLEFYPVWLMKIVNFLPFKQIIYVPVSILIGNLSGIEALKAILYQAMWIGIIYVFYELLWKASIRKLVVLGG